ncbi:hypothetical protein KYK30_30080 [Shinella yambaruensis]|uniref:Uncharacterized protein n=1 Tax=Shinella yambaruensis TaxID=415996 RepID=A0ABQ5ZE59_9HYPH|nr:hypothetical protein [Shinella yambaruensis]MCJ8028721.1 hypothetical protein [Shinella yambaruensis]MCU7983970.1 hypothetical protein [Shinella yambaruensis]GLR49910.1 hypothetical protein GCM10007923_11150 [Shinella yambaruensis]
MQRALSILALTALCTAVSYTPSPSARAATTGFDILVNWKCRTQQSSFGEKCKNFTQRIRTFEGGRVQLQENGFFCGNERRGNEVGYDAFLNRRASGSFLCHDGSVKFEIRYSTSVTFNETSLIYKVSGSAKDVTAGVRSSQKVHFENKVSIVFSKQGCRGERFYRISQGSAGIPMGSTTFKFEALSCKRRG